MPTSSWYLIMTIISEEYQKALDYLYQFVDYSLTRNFRYAEDKFDLNRVVELLALLGNPQKNYQIIHVAGTKGKGSTSALIASALQSAGYKTGFYSSPHLEDFTERFQVNKVFISQDDFTKLLEEMKPSISKIKELTTFEIATALAFLYFSRQAVDIAVLEVGLGGRLDATNVIDPLVSVITSISYDHMAVLGDTLTKIATEKAGIIKEGRDVVISPQTEEARKVILQIAEDHHAPVTQVGVDYLYASRSHSLWGQTFYIWSKKDQELVDEFINSSGRLDWEPDRFEIPLLGYHQIENAATAYAALQIVKEHGIKITNKDILDGFSKVKWPARFEILRREPPVIVDSAHNRDSALRLRLAMDDYLPELPIILVFGASEDKDIDGMFAELLPRVDKVIATKSVHPRAIEPEELVKLAHRFGKQAIALSSVEEALSEANRLAQREAAILVTGSIFIAAAAREAWPEILNKS